MISSKRKRKIVVNNQSYYWYCNTKIHIISEDKKKQFVCGYDKDVCIGPSEIREIILKHDL
jgi:hypothetical protein